MNDKRLKKIRITVKARNPQDAIALLKAAEEAVRNAYSGQPPATVLLVAEDVRTVPNEQTETAVCEKVSQHLDAINVASEKAAKAPTAPDAPPVDLEKAKTGRQKIRAAITTGVKHGWQFTVNLYEVTLKAVAKGIVDGLKGP